MAPHELTPLAWLLLAGAIGFAILAVIWNDKPPADDEPPNLDTRGPDDR